MKEARVIHHHG